MAQFISVKVDNLRRLGYNSLKHWIETDENHVYVGRRGRIFITDENKIKTMFQYEGSKWANPFKVGVDGDVSTCVEKYHEYLHKSGLINDIGELNGKHLGCFCDQNADHCHAKLLVKLISKIK